MRLARGRRVARQIVRLRAQLGLGADRLDYTTGIVHRFAAIERFLEKYPEYQGCFGFVQVAVPSRTQIEDYRRVKAQVECAVERINTRFGIGTFKPIHYRYTHLEPAELVAYYRMADVTMVTSLHDSMNLAAKEFVASQVAQRGVLICSEFAGAAEALDTALLIKPYDTEGVADTLKHAIEMSRKEKAHRMARLQMHIAKHHIYKWLADIFTTIEHIQEANDSAVLAVVEAPGCGAPMLYV
jgi:trehalose-6-phosphate synthase